LGPPPRRIRSITPRDCDRIGLAAYRRYSQNIFPRRVRPCASGARPTGFRLRLVFRARSYRPRRAAELAVSPTLANALSREGVDRRTAGRNARRSDRTPQGRRGSARPGPTMNSSPMLSAASAGPSSTALLANHPRHLTSANADEAQNKCASRPWFHLFGIGLI
jgi:hypothetical protein